MAKLRAGVLAVVLLGGLLSCSGSDDGEELTIYAGRDENLVRPLLERYAEETGANVKVRYASTDELLPVLLEEGSETPADVFLSQDAGALGELASKGMLEALPQADLDKVQPRFRDPDGRWVGVTGRARVIAYNTERVREAELPTSVLGVTDSRWRGRVGFPPTNASFVAFVSALREQLGDERTRAFLEGLEANGAKRFDNNVAVLDAVASGEVDLGLVNHYYLYNEFEERPDAPVANFYPGQGPNGEGTFVNVSGVGVLAGTDAAEPARRFVDFLLSEESQRYFRDETAEYPLADGVTPIEALPPLDRLRTIDVPLTDLGRDLEGTLAMLDEVGLT